MGKVEVLDKISTQEGDLLSRCLVGYCSEKPKERTTLADIRRWSSTNWKKAFGINIYELNDEKFLFEFPNRNMAEQTINDKWRWKSCNFNLEWWKQITGCTPKYVLVKETWIRVVGIPLHLWSKKVFQEIGEIFGGWLATEEETEIKNHMKWARILVVNDGSSIPRGVEVSRNDTKFHLPIWPECLPRFESSPKNDKGEDETYYPVKKFTQGILEEVVGDNTRRSHQTRDLLLSQHVTTSEKVKSKACEGHVSLLNETLEVDHQVGPNSKLQIEVPDMASLIIANNFQEDITVVQSTFDFIKDITTQVAMNNNSQLPEKRSSHAMVTEKSIELIGENESQIVGDEADSQLERNFDMGGDDQINSGVTTRNSEIELVNWEIDDVEPLMVQQQLVTQGKEKEASNWVQQNLIKLGKIFGIDFQGHEEEVTELLMQIDSCRHARKLESCSEIKKTKTKDVQELKNLVCFDVKFKSIGNRGKGRSASAST
ncbi:hypothetical protein KY290_007789 [Solanum tuberosum]|uniref:DUF4283 domain-containing protein n=1 Tax=Solanum tuberosum TaxID=4113 RepID=A0ABQ7W6K0_SOLTU|nr:hypothetical protein KY290_007789 [Solanum tuberosum]